MSWVWDKYNGAHSQWFSACVTAVVSYHVLWKNTVILSTHTATQHVQRNINSTIRLASRHLHKSTRRSALPKCKTIHRSSTLKMWFLLFSTINRSLWPQWTAQSRESKRGHVGVVCMCVCTLGFECLHQKWAIQMTINFVSGLEISLSTSQGELER